MTGFCALSYQMIWQKYFSILIGAEARSSTIVIANFLICLALGNYLFGKLSSSISERRKILYFYGWGELIIGFYAAIFPTIFNIVFNQSMFIFNSIISQIFIVFLLICIPATLMGATIPMLTKCLPEDPKTINDTHTQIYGLNTLGAFLGCLVSSFYFIHIFGLALSSNLIGSINIICSLLFISNRLVGSCSDANDHNNINHNFDNKLLYLFALISGIVSISLEIIWFRITALTIGSSILVVPFVISLFILGLGSGSLTVKNATLKSFQTDLKYASFFILVSFLAVPFLPLWVSNIRVLLISHPVNYYIFYSIVYLLLAFFLVPVTFFQGRILPYLFMFYPKDKGNYGKFCGYLYAINTAGTFLGAIFVGYLGLYFFSIELLFKLVLLLLLIITIYIFKKDFKKSYLLILFLISIPFLSWNRTYHEVGLFRRTEVTADNFQGLFTILPFSSTKTIYFNDGPNATITVQKNIANPDGEGLFIVNNGKSDGHTLYDFGTVSLAALIPYLFTDKKEDIKANVIGAGTGITAGLLGTFKDVKSVDVIEISNNVISALPYFSDSNYDVLHSQKVGIFITDAFQFLKNKQNEYDIIVSEPSNPWTVGVENLFTPEFYSMAHNSLTKNGILVQWIHTYSLDNQILRTVFKNALSSFQQAEVYNTIEGDILLVISKGNNKLMINQPERFNEPIVANVFKKNSLLNLDSLEVIKMFNNEQLDLILQNPYAYSHDIYHPTLSLYSLKAFFLNTSANLNTLINPYIARIFKPEQILKKQKSFNDYINDNNGTSLFKPLCNNDFAKIAICQKRHIFKAFQDWKNLIIKNEDAIMAYSILRKEGLIGVEQIKLIKMLDLSNKEIFNSLINEIKKDGRFEFEECLKNKGQNKLCEEINHTIKQSLSLPNVGAESVRN
jgi:spermidine synthase